MKSIKKTISTLTATALLCGVALGCPVSAETLNSQIYTATDFSAVDFINSAYDTKNYIAYDGSDEENYFSMVGRKYYQGAVLRFYDENYSVNYSANAAASYNVEDIDCLTFTVGRIDNSPRVNAYLKIYSDGALWYTLSLNPGDVPQEYTINTKKMTTIRFLLEDTGSIYDFPQYALANIALNDDYSDFTDGTYAVSREVYTDPSEIISINDLKTYVLGDINDDESINITDAAAVLSEYAKESADLDKSFTSRQKLAGDTNKDGSIDITDATYILGYYAYLSAGLGNYTLSEYIASLD